MPLSKAFERRLLPQLPEIVRQFGTPFHLYDETGIRRTCQEFQQAFAGEAFRQYFAVKALPNPWIMAILREEGMGFDCASVPELELAQWAGAAGEALFFTSNNTQPHEFARAQALNAIINLDDSSFVDQLSPFPALACFRVSNDLIDRQCGLMGSAQTSKFGLPEASLEAAYAAARAAGATRFGLHAMLCSNELNANRAIELAEQIFARAAKLCTALAIPLEFINIGGGIGIPYRPEESAFDFPAFAAGVLSRKRRYFNGPQIPSLYTECGRYVTGPHGVLVTRVTNVMHKRRNIIGVNASMSALMRPAMYADAYHHITLPFTEPSEQITADVVGSLCENIDKFAILRRLPKPALGDILLIHDTGAHGSAMGFNYNGRLRPQELLLRQTGDVVLIRRAEQCQDYFATLPTQLPESPLTLN